jgi:hypothetical protein
MPVVLLGVFKWVSVEPPDERKEILFGEALQRAMGPEREAFLAMSLGRYLREANTPTNNPIPKATPIDS